jgi:hypothetical protein
MDAEGRARVLPALRDELVRRGWRDVEHPVRRRRGRSGNLNGDEVLHATHPRSGATVVVTTIYPQVEVYVEQGCFGPLT